VTTRSGGFPAFVDGRVIPAGQPAMVPAHDAGFRTGWGAFTTLRARGVDAALLERHVTRLADDAAAIGIPIGADDVLVAARSLLAVERGVDQVVVRITVTAGGPVDVDAWPQVAAGHASLVITLHAAPALPAPPVRAITHDARRWPGAVKSTSYLASVLATRDARAAGADVAVLCDGDELLETAEGNLFALLDDELADAAWPDGRLLPGLTRELVRRRSSGPRTQGQDRTVASPRRRARPCAAGHLVRGRHPHRADARRSPPARRCGAPGRGGRPPGPRAPPAGRCSPRWSAGDAERLGRVRSARRLSRRGPRGPRGRARRASPGGR
jgi:branched-subunit amino acid aminotransferase/4-amino-4-deoxychorismate lyase